MDILESNIRFSGADWFNAVKVPVTIIGVGTIGSWTSLLISRLGVPRMDLYDEDTIERTNLAGQLFPTSSIGLRKVNMAQALIKGFNYGIVTYPIPSHITSDHILHTPIVISGVDSMNARKVIWKAIKNSEDVKYYIDGRMSAEGLQVLTVDLSNPHQIEKYEKEWLFDSSEATGGEVCSYKQTSHIGAMIGAFIANIVTNIASNREEADRRSVPFFIQYTAEDLLLNIEM